MTRRRRTRNNDRMITPINGWPLEPHEDLDAQPDADGVTCRGCDHFILDSSDEYCHKLQGWWWCDDCYDELPEVVDGRDQEARDDEAKHEQ